MATLRVSPLASKENELIRRMGEVAPSDRITWYFSLHRYEQLMMLERYRRGEKQQGSQDRNTKVALKLVQELQELPGYVTCCSYPS